MFRKYVRSRIGRSPMVDRLSAGSRSTPCKNGAKEHGSEGQRYPFRMDLEHVLSDDSL